MKKFSKNQIIKKKKNTWILDFNFLNLKSSKYIKKL